MKATAIVSALALLALTACNTPNGANSSKYNDDVYYSSIDAAADKAKKEQEVADRQKAKDEDAKRREAEQSQAQNQKQSQSRNDDYYVEGNNKSRKSNNSDYNSNDGYQKS